MAKRLPIENVIASRPPEARDALGNMLSWGIFSLGFLVLADAFLAYKSRARPDPRTLRMGFGEKIRLRPLVGWRIGARSGCTGAGGPDGYWHTGAIVRFDCRFDICLLSLDTGRV